MDKTKHEEIADAWVECNKARQERDGYLGTIRETFRVLESRGQAPDDNAPLSVTVWRVLDDFDRVTAERDALRGQVEDRTRQIIEARQQKADAIHERDTLKGRVRELDHYASGAAELHQELEDARAECDALAAELAALKKRITDAPKSHTFQTGYGFVALPARGVEANGTYALLRLEDGEG